jgi:hypothetical protein
VKSYFCRIQDARKRYPRAYLHWSATEEADLAEAVMKGNGISQLSKIFQRQPKAIESRLKAMKVTLK